MAWFVTFYMQVYPLYSVIQHLHNWPLDCQDQVYLRHLSVDTIGSHIGRVLINKLFKLVDCRSPLSVEIHGHNGHTQSICPLILVRHLDHYAGVAYRSTVCGVSVDCNWYMCIVNLWCTEMVAIAQPLPFTHRGSERRVSIACAHMLIGRGYSSNSCHFECTCTSNCILNTYLTYIPQALEWMKEGVNEEMNEEM